MEVQQQPSLKSSCENCPLGKAQRAANPRGFSTARAKTRVQYLLAQTETRSWMLWLPAHGDQRCTHSSEQQPWQGAIIVTLLATVHARMPVQASQTKELTCSISGRVTIGGLPARGITVVLSSAENGPYERPLAKAATDQDGRFHLTGVPAGHIYSRPSPLLSS